jgi:iron complex transport system permease protein
VALRSSYAALLGLLAGALLCVLLFLTVGANGQWDFVLPFRGTKILTMVLVGYCIAVSAVLFQTATGNRILTPGIMGFDSLFILLQTLIVFSIGAQGYTGIDHRVLFAGQTLLMMGFAAVLYRLLFHSSRRSLHLLVLTGIVLGILFRSLSEFAGRVISPNEYLFLQDRFFASFNTPDTQLLAVSFMVVGAVSLLAWRMLPAFDVLGLGRDSAISLGVDHRRTVGIILGLAAIMVSISTALVGPVTFFGLLVSNLAYWLIRSHRHVLLLPAATLIAIISLLAGQLVLEQALGFGTNLRVVLEFAGGITFILLLLRDPRR